MSGSGVEVWWEKMERVKGWGTRYRRKGETNLLTMKEIK